MRLAIVYKDGRRDIVDIDEVRGDERVGYDLDVTLADTQDLARVACDCRCDLSPFMRD